MAEPHNLTDEQKKILERMRAMIDYIIRTHKEYLDALAEFDRTGVLKIHGKVLSPSRKILPDGTKLYKWDELDKAIEEAEDVDLTVSDLILFLLWCDKDIPIIGKRKLIKEAYVFWTELTSRGYKVENPHFYHYRGNPYSQFIIDTVEDLYFAGFIIIASGMKRRQYVYMLNKKGLTEVEEMVREKIRPNDIEYFTRRRRELDMTRTSKI